jgi:mannose-6-phosphate isomerase-like protein (cupin superfamily)
METVATSSDDFRRVLWTGRHTQLVIMTIPVRGEIGAEVHDHNDQILSFIRGRGEAQVGGETKPVVPGDVVVVPAGTKHNFVNTGEEPLVLSTVYGPPDHAPGTVHHTKEEAEAAEAAGEDEPPSS